MHSGGRKVNFGACILGADGLRLNDEEKALFRDMDPFGFILFARNFDTADQVRALCDDFRNAVGRDALITVDQEGGRVQRVRAPMGREWMAPLDHVKQAKGGAERAMYLRYRLIADELRGLGIDSNCAPILDVAGDETHPFLHNRCYGFDPDTVARLGRAVANGLLDGGVVPVVKHIPGHGRATQDSHFDLPHVTADLAALDLDDFAPFKALNDMAIGMTAHLVYDVVDDLPATLSSAMMTMIRDRIGFDGLIMTDDISMKALNGAVGDLCRASIMAGCDVVLHCNGTLADRAAVASASGRMNDVSQVRALAAIAARTAPDTFDISAAEAELLTLMDGRVYDG